MMSGRMLLDPKDCALMVVDVQGKLAKLVKHSDSLIERIVRLVRAARLLNIPIIWVEQNPEGLGQTVQSIAEALEDTPCFEKNAFNAMSDSAIARAVTQLKQRYVLICGIEAHVCVYQSTCGLLDAGKHVIVLEDCVSSRSESDRRVGIERMQSVGASLRSLEMALFELLGDASHPRFKQVLQLIK